MRPLAPTTAPPLSLKSNLKLAYTVAPAPAPAPTVPPISGAVLKAVKTGAYVDFLDLLKHDTCGDITSGT